MVSQAPSMGVLYNLTISYMTEEVRKKPISGELRSLKVGGVVVFPMEQRSSVMSVISRFRRDLIRENWNCKVDEVKSRCELVVTRIH